MSVEYKFMDPIFYLVPLFFLTALVYSTAGFGGGSTYLALMVLLGIPYKIMPQTALICNLLVVSGGFWIFYRAGHFSVRKVLPFVITSIPAAYLGGRIPIGKTLFLWILGLSLMFAGLRMLLNESAFKEKKTVSWKQAWTLGLPLGTLLGGMSGLVGIGGGIFLAPVIYLLGWANAKEVSAAASFFILVNSLAGLGGQWAKSGWTVEWSLVAPLGVAVFLGGQIGSRLGAGKISKFTLQRITAALILFVAGRVLWGLI